MEEGKILSKGDILRVDDSVYEEVMVDEWGGSVRLHVISAKDRMEFESKFTLKDGSIDFSANDAPLELLASSLRNAAGTPMFSKEEMVILGTKNGKVIHNLFQKALELNWMTKKKEADCKKK